MQFDVDGGLPQQALNRRLEPQDLFDEWLEVAVGVALDLLPDVRVADQQHHAARQGVRRGLGAADEQVGHHLGVQLIVGQGATPLLDLVVDQIAEQ